MSTAMSTKRSPAINDAVRARVTPARREDAQTDRASAIQTNAFHKIMFSAATPEQKRAELAKALAFSGTKTENRERIKEFEAFKEYLSAVREDMAKEIIKLTDTEAFSELQAVYGGLNNDLLAFDDAMRPLTEILDALHTLRTNGVTFDAFKEIKQEKQDEDKRRGERIAVEAELQMIEARMRAIRSDVAVLGEQRGLFGFGGVPTSAREEIARKEVEAKELADRLEAARTKLTEMGTAAPAGEQPYAAEKAKLRELLDITSDEHKDRQKALVANALRFCETANERVGSVRKHLGLMNAQVDHLYDSNAQMNLIFAVMNEGIKDAGAKNLEIRESLSAPRDGEDSLQKIQREQAKADIEGHITMLDESALDTMGTSADLTSQSIRIKTMKEANDTQISKARTLQTQGVAGVADRLSVVLQAVSAAALGESSAMARDTLARMRENTNLVAQKETIRVAAGVDESNAEIEKAIEDLNSYGDVMRAATDIQRAGITELRKNFDRLRAAAQQTQESIKESVGVAADVAAGAGPAAAPHPEAPLSPFTFGAR